MTASVPARSTSPWAATDPGLATALLMAAIASWPLLSRASLPTLTDAQHHIYRTYEILAAWREGIPYLRWAPDFYFGFGYPVFNYYSPLTYYLAAAYGWFWGPVAGIKFVLVLAAGLGTIGVYLLARELYGAVAAIASAGIFAFAPYLVLNDPILRGAVPEALAIGLAPWVLWTFTRLTRTGSPRHFVASAVSLTALVLAHNLMSVVFIGLMGGWLAWDLFLGDRRDWPASKGRIIVWLSAAGALSLALCAFLWLPAFIERGAVQYQNAFAAAAPNRLNSIETLFRAARPHDAEITVPNNFEYPLGLPQWVFGLAGALAALRPGPRRRSTIFFILVSAGAIALMLPQAGPVWDHLPGLSLLQFSFRLIGVTSITLGLLAGASLQLAATAGKLVRPGRLAAAIAAVSVLAAVPVLNPLPWPAFGAVNPQAIVDLEITGLWGVGTTSSGEFLPVGVRQVPKPLPAMLAALNAGTVEKVDRLTLPAGATVEATNHKSLRDDFRITAPSNFDLRLHTFYWPGWTAYLDGRPTPLQVTVPDGWISVAIPAGTHALTVQLEDTWPQRLGWAVSAAGLIALAAVTVAGVRHRRGVQLNAPTNAPTVDAPRTPDGGPASALGGRLALGVAGVLIAGLGLRLALDFSQQWQAVHMIPEVPAAQVQRFTRFDDGLALVAYDFRPTSAAPGADVPLTFYWEAVTPMDQPVSVFVHFYGPDGQVWGQSDQADPVELFPTTRWPIGQIMADPHRVHLKPDAPAGLYTVAVGLWNRATGARSHPLDSTGQPTDLDKLTLTDHFQVRP